MAAWSVLFVIFSLCPFLLWLLCIVFGLWVFLPAFLRLSSLWPLCAVSCVVGLLPFLFGLFVAGFVVLCGGSPPLVVASLPLRLFPAASWSSFCAGPSLWVSGCFMQQPGCLVLMLGVWWCFASSLHFASWQQRPLALCGVCVTPLHMVHLLLWSSVLLYWGIHLQMIQDPLETAKLHTRDSRLHVWHALLLSFSAFPAPFSPFCVGVVFGVVLPFVQFLLPSLRREKSGAQFSLCVFSGVSKALVDLKHSARKEFCH